MFGSAASQGHYAPDYLIQNDGNIGSADLDKAVFPAGSTGLTWDELFALPRNPEALYDCSARPSVTRATTPTVRCSRPSETCSGRARHPRHCVRLASSSPPASPAWNSRPASTTPRAALPRRSVARTRKEQVPVRYLIDASTGALLDEQDVNPVGGTAFLAILLASGRSPTRRPRSPAHSRSRSPHANARTRDEAPMRTAGRVTLLIGHIDSPGQEAATAVRLLADIRREVGDGARVVVYDGAFRCIHIEEVMTRYRWLVIARLPELGTGDAPMPTAMITGPDGRRVVSHPLGTVTHETLAGRGVHTLVAVRQSPSSVGAWPQAGSKFSGQGVVLPRLERPYQRTGSGGPMNACHERVVE